MTINYQIRNIAIASAIAIAIALAAAAALLTIVYVKSANDDKAAAETDVTVYVARQSFPAGTTGAKLAGALRPVVVQRQAAAPVALADPAQLKGLVTTQPIFAGEQLTMKRFATVEQQGIRHELAGKLRAIRVAGDANQVLLETLEAGDRVDVVASFKTGVAPRETTAVVLRGIRVLEVPESDTSGINARDEHGVVLAVTDRQAQRLVFAVDHGKWWLQLRPVRKPRDSGHAVDTFATVLAKDAR